MSERPCTNFCNGLILELHQYLLRRNLPWRTMGEWFARLGLCTTPLPPRRTQYLVEKVLKEKQSQPRGRKKDPQKYEEFLRTEFKIPEMATALNREVTTLQQQVRKLNDRNAALAVKCFSLNEKRKVANADKRRLEQELSMLEKDSDQVLDDLLKEQDENADLVAKLEKAEKCSEEREKVLSYYETTSYPNNHVPRRERSP